MYLLITESPAKANKIKGFLNSNYRVISSCGHIRDLEKKKTKVYGDPKGFGIDIDNNFQAKYVIIPEKKKVVRELKEESVGCNIIYAADDDREGEAIAWHTSIILKSNAKEKNRIVFREVSKKAILDALNRPRNINMNEVNSQQARRIIDRLIGFKLSPCLWKHIKTNVKGLSAGRVQSALLNLIEEREKYIKDYQPKRVLTIEGNFHNNEKKCDFMITKSIEGNDLFKLFRENRIFLKRNINEKVIKEYPDKPFITSTLQQTASKRFGYSIKYTMNIAQKLYESGHITYMRTDSTLISEDFSKRIKDLIKLDYGKEYYKKPNPKKVKGAQEAHEAIRMTSLKTPELFGDESKLYNLIYDRTITSHMREVEYMNYTIHIDNNKISEYGYFIVIKKQLLFAGYRIYYDNTLLKEEKPQIENEYILKQAVTFDKCENEPQYYDESSIVSLLEKSGIGRPSTYSTIVGTLDNRNYTLKGDYTEEDKEVEILTLKEDDEISITKHTFKGRIQKKRIRMTPLGRDVLSYLREYFSNIIQKEFTCEKTDKAEVLKDHAGT